MENGLEQQVLAKAQKWLDGNYDAETKKQVKCCAADAERNSFLCISLNFLTSGTIVTMTINSALHSIWMISLSIVPMV